MHFCRKEILDGLVSKDGVVLAVDNNCFAVKRYVAVTLPGDLTSIKELPTVCGISAVSALKAVLLADMDERLCKLMDIPWTGISIYKEDNTKRIFPDGPYEFFLKGRRVSIPDLSEGDVFHIHYDGGKATGPFIVTESGSEGGHPYVDYKEHV